MGRLWWPGIRPLEPVGSVQRFIKSWILIFSLHTCVCVELLKAIYYKELEGMVAGM